MHIHVYSIIFAIGTIIAIPSDGLAKAPSPHEPLDTIDSASASSITRGEREFYKIPSASFIIRWAFQDYCDHVFDPCDNPVAWPTVPKGGVTFNPDQVKAGDTIFVRDIDYFFETIGKKITAPFIMVTHGEFRDTAQERQLSYLNDERAIAWFSIHPTHQGHKKYFPIPLGIMQDKKNYEERDAFSAFLKEQRQKPKKKLLYMNFDATLNKERQQLHKRFKNEPYCLTREKAISFKEYMEEMADCKFALSPRGWGPDCYRTWEALYVGTIPIVLRKQSGQIVTVKTQLRHDAPPKPKEPQLSKEIAAQPSQLDTLYEGLPILVLDSWDQLSEEFLEQKYEEITAQAYSMEKLTLEYWFEKIESVRAAFLNNRPATVSFDAAMEYKKDGSSKKAQALIDIRRQDPLLMYCKNLYEKHPYIPQDKVQQANTSVLIPQIIHLIWVGPHPVPASYEKLKESITKYMPSWECKLWTDKDIPALKLTTQAYYDAEPNYGGKADILRYELLYRYGGVYLDIDFEVTKDLSPLHSQYEFYCCLMPANRISVISNGVIGCVPGHPIMKECIASLAQHTKDPFVLERTGPILFQNAFYKIAQNRDSRPIVALPKNFFFPHIPKNMASDKNLYPIPPHTFGIHHWGGNWVDEENHDHHKKMIKAMRS